MEDLVNSILKGAATGVASKGTSRAGSSITSGTGTGFLGMCSNCKKTMKNPDVFNKHIKTQKCISEGLRTYCSVCDIVLDGREAYKRHLISQEHFNLIVAKDIPKFDIEKVRKSLNTGCEKKNTVKDNETIKTMIDPFLSEKDKDKLVSSIKNKDSIGDGIVICFNVEKGQGLEGKIKVDFERTVDDVDKNKKIEKDIDTIINSSSARDIIRIVPPTVNNINIHNKKYEMSEGSGSDIGSLKDFEYVAGVSGVGVGVGGITERQIKILGFLKGLVGVEGSNSKFLVALNKLNPDDYNGLAMAIIQCDEIPILERQNYINVIRKYKELLQKKMVSGRPTHNGFDINMILKNLSF
jgi:hypothetical protein